jgi:hypothetical protein
VIVVVTAFVHSFLLDLKLNIHIWNVQELDGNVEQPNKAAAGASTVSLRSSLGSTLALSPFLARGRIGKTSRLPLKSDFVRADENIPKSAVDLLYVWDRAKGGSR